MRATWRLNILLINHYAGSPRARHGVPAYYLAREWVRARAPGADRRRAQSHVRARQPQLHGRSALDETIDGIDYRWLRDAALPRQRRRARAQHRGLLRAPVPARAGSWRASSGPTW